MQEVKRMKSQDTTNKRVKLFFLIIPILISGVSSLFLFTVQWGPVVEAAYWTPVNTSLTLLFVALMTIVYLLYRRDRVWILTGSVIAGLMGIIAVGVYYAWYQDYPLGGTAYFRAGLVAANIAGGIFLCTFRLWAKLSLIAPEQKSLTTEAAYYPQDKQKYWAVKVVEYCLLGLCLSVVALRATLTEGPPMRATTLASNLSNNLYSLTVSTFLVLSLVLWVIWSFCGKRFLYRLTGIEIGLCLFCVAAIVAGLAAADERLAITDIAVFLAPPLMALLLVQLLDSQTKIELVLIVIAALGVVSAYRCTEQISENEHLIEFYEQNPQAALMEQQIVPDSLDHFQFEHRLYSKDISGFFTTSNSAGSFALLASFAAVTLFIERYRNRKSDPLGFAWLITCGIGVAIVVLGLVITTSKGAMIALVFAVVAFLIILLFGARLRAHRKAILITCSLLVVAGGWLVVSYGLKHDRLPGGNSMLVRWQYWRASGQMYADHPLTGVGPGNFGHFYPHYKPAAALESVADPHNFPLSILTQYGPLGLTGFLAMILIPLWRVSASSHVSTPLKAHGTEPDFKKTAIGLAIVISAVLLCIRPIVFPIPPTASPQEKEAGIIIFYIVPVIVFIAGFTLLAAGMRPARKSHTGISSAALFCAVLGVLLHNLIDFAIFEPGVLTAFWAIIACLVAIGRSRDPGHHVVLKPPVFAKILVAAAAAVTIAIYLIYALVPAARSTAKIRQATQAISVGRLEQAHNLLDKAAKDDSLSAAALSMNGRLYLHPYGLTPNKDRSLLLKAEKCFKAAVERNHAAFKNFERLTEVYSSLADISTEQEKTDWLNKALESALAALERYPGCGRLHFNLAQVAEKLGKTDIAIRQYEQAVEIEDEYRAQFRQMYPEREKIVSRLGQEKYDFAIRRAKELSTRFDI